MLQYAASLCFPTAAIDGSVPVAGPTRPKCLSPPQDMVKINSDATFKPNICVGFGMMARDAAGEMLVVASFLHGSLLCAVVVEAMTFK